MQPYLPSLTEDAVLRQKYLRICRLWGAILKAVGCRRVERGEYWPVSQAQCPAVRNCFGPIIIPPQELDTSLSGERRIKRPDSRTAVVDIRPLCEASFLPAASVRLWICCSTRSESRGGGSLSYNVLSYHPHRERPEAARTLPHLVPRVELTQRREVPRSGGQARPRQAVSRGS